MWVIHFLIAMSPWKIFRETSLTEGVYTCRRLQVSVCTTRREPGQAELSHSESIDGTHGAQWRLPPSPLRDFHDTSPVPTVPGVLIVREPLLATQALEEDTRVMLSSPEQLHFLASLCKAIGVRNAIDIGTFTGASALAVAEILPVGGRVVTCDVNGQYVAVGKPFWIEAGVDDQIDLRVGPATCTLDKLLEEGKAGTYDFAYVDANKSDYGKYYEACLKLVRPGGLIAMDNMFLGGKVIDPAHDANETVQNIRKLNKKIHEDERVQSSLLALADGTVLAFKK